MSEEQDLEKALGITSAAPQKEPSLVVMIVVGFLFVCGLILTLIGGICGAMNVAIAPAFLIVTLPTLGLGLVMMIPSFQFLTGSGRMSKLSAIMVGCVSIFVLGLLVAGMLQGSHFRFAG